MCVCVCMCWEGVSQCRMLLVEEKEGDAGEGEWVVVVRVCDACEGQTLALVASCVVVPGIGLLDSCSDLLETAPLSLSLSLALPPLAESFDASELVD